MRLRYYPETESLYIELRDESGTNSREVADGLLADLNDQGRVVGLDIDCAIHKVDLSEVDAVGFPLQKSVRSC